MSATNGASMCFTLRVVNCAVAGLHMTLWFGQFVLPTQTLVNEAPTSPEGFVHVYAQLSNMFD